MFFIQFKRCIYSCSLRFHINSKGIFMFTLSTRSFAVLLAAILIIFFCSSPAKSATSEVEKLLAVGPDDMLGFLATSGADDLKSSFNETTLGQIWNEPGVQTFYQSIKQELLKKIKQGMADPNDVKTFEAIMNLTKLGLNRPIIIGVVRKDTKVDKCPVYGFAVLEAGQRKAEITSAIAKLEALAEDGEIIDVNIGSYLMHGTKDDKGVPKYWGWIGNYFVFAVNESKGLAIKHLNTEQSRLAPDYLSKVPGTGDAIAMYVKSTEILDVLHVIASMEGNNEGFNLNKIVMKELGLDRIKKISARTGFSGSDVVFSEFLEMPSPCTGLMSHFKPIKLSAFDMVDARAMNAAAVNWDVAGMYDTIFYTFEVVSPNEAYPKIQQAIAKFESQAKFSIRKGLLQSLSGETVYYTLPAGIMMEAPTGGGVLIAKLNDAALFEKTVTALEEFAAAKSNGMLQVSSQIQDGRTLHTWAIMPLAMMQVMPTWTIVDNHVVVATNATLCDTAVAQIGSMTNSIRNTEGYKKVTAKLPNDLIGLRYTDSKVQFNQMMIGMQQFWPMITMAATNAGISLPFMLPTLSHISNNMGPSCGYSWFDSEGLHVHYKGTGIEQSMGSVAGVSLVAGILMPALAKVRSQAQIMISATNLSKIGKACLIYANDCNDSYPQNLQTLVDKADLQQKILDSPRKPKGFDGPSYIYITGQSPSSPPDNILVYENPGFCSDKINVLFNDCHVQAMKPEEFLKELEATYKRLGRKIPEIKFEGFVKSRFPHRSWSPEAKAWALGCAAVLNERNHCRHDTLLPCDKSENNIKAWKKSLDRWWGDKNREDLLESLRWIEEGGHRKRFDDWGKYIQSLSEEQYQRLVEEKSGNMEKLCEILTAKEYYEKLGEKSLLGWDYSRYICLCRWGYLVGYISEEEAWERIMPVAEMLQKKFDSWEDLGQNYLIGRRFWSYQYVKEDGDEYEDAVQRLIDMRSSPWNRYKWNMDLAASTAISDPNTQAQ